MCTQANIARPGSGSKSPCFAPLLLALCPVVASPLAAADAWDIGRIRREIQKLVDVRDDNQFIAGYAQLFARHHVAPIMNKGKDTPAGAGATFAVSKEGAVSLRDFDGHVSVPKHSTFVRAVTQDGQWKTLDDQPIGQVVTLLIKARKTLFLLNMKTEMIGVIETAELRN